MKFRIFTRERDARVSRKVAIVVAVSVLFLLCTCGFFKSGEREGMMADSNTMIDEATARAIARRDAMHMYRDLSIYKVKAELKDGKWYVDYGLEGERVIGGGPHYVISATTGEILSRRYAQ